MEPAAQILPIKDFLVFVQLARVCLERSCKYIFYENCTRTHFLEILLFFLGRGVELITAIQKDHKWFLLQRY